MVSLEYFIDIKSFRSHYGPGIDSASNRNEYQEYFLGGKGGRCLWLTTLPLFCTVVIKSGTNFLEPSGPLQACNGTDLPFTYFNGLKVTFHKSRNMWKATKLILKCGNFFFNVSQTEVFNTYMNIYCISQTQQNFMFIIVLGLHVSTLSELSSGPSKIQILT